MLSRQVVKYIKLFRIEQHVDCEKRDWLIKMPKDIEESLSLACLCLEKSLKYVPISRDLEQKSLIKRIGNVKNELGAFYMNQVNCCATNFGTLEN